MNSARRLVSAHDVCNATEHVGAIEMRVEVAEATTASEQRWERRADALAGWLMAEWQRDRMEAA